MCGGRDRSQTRLNTYPPGRCLRIRSRPRLWTRASQDGGISYHWLTQYKGMSHHHPGSFRSLNRQRRPICWTKSSVIFTPHPVQPLVLGRVFSSSKKFTLPLPLPIRSSPQSYEPPTLISVSPDDTLLFAYFPAHYGLVPVAVLWQRGLQIDEWIVKEFDFWKPHHLSDGIVAVSWTTTEREVCIFKRDVTSFIHLYLLFVVGDWHSRLVCSPTNPWSPSPNFQLHASSRVKIPQTLCWLCSPIPSKNEGCQLYPHAIWYKPRKPGDPVRRQNFWAREHQIL